VGVGSGSVFLPPRPLLDSQHNATLGLINLEQNQIIAIGNVGACPVESWVSVASNGDLTGEKADWITAGLTVRF
jgi:hypothetical protein